MNPAFSDFLESSCLALAREVPEFPTHMGIFEIAGEPIPQDRFTNIDPGSTARRQQLLASINENLGKFPPAELDDSEQLTAGVLHYFVHYVHEFGLTGLAGKDLLQNDYLVRPAVGIQSELPLFLSDLHPMRNAQDAEDYLSRLKSITTLLSEADRQVQQREQAGYLPPAIVLEGAIAEIRDFLVPDPDQNILYQSLADKSVDLQGLTEKSRLLLLADARSELSANTYPAYRELLATLEIQASRSHPEPGVWRLPDGDAWYGFLLAIATTTNMPAAEIHELGLEEVDRLERDIIRASRALGIDARSINDCHRELDSRKGAPREDTPGNRRSIVSQVEAVIAEIEPKLPGLFHQLPKGRVAVKPMPLFAEANRNQSYQPPSLDGSRDGFLELNVGQLLDQADFELPILVYHELFPGHHLQISLAQETEALPTLRRICTFDAYTEGWAKYAETIPARHGMNLDPMLDLARMRRELISTINLALDTGIHQKRWSESRAAAFFKAHSGMGDQFARYIVSRSASVPAQLCSYKIGMRKMLELRQRMELTLGQHFDIRDFHHSVLSRGALPLDLLDKTVNQDIARLSKKSASPH